MTISTTYTTKQVSEIVGINISTIHYYDNLGIIPDIKRSKNGYRLFTIQNINWLKDLQVFADSGMTLKDIKKLTDLIFIDKQDTSNQQLKIIDEHIATLVHKRENIDQQIRFMYDFIAEHDLT